jgi:transcriptional regulator with XRE-family HTH domain
MRRFSKWLKETRIKRGMTQAHLAQAIGVTDSYISHLEHGDFLTKAGIPCRPAVALVDAMAQALDVPCEEARLAATYAPPDQGSQLAFGQWVREARLKIGMTQKTLAQSIGVTDSYVSLLELQKTAIEQGSPIRPSLHLVDGIARTLGTSCDEARLIAGYAAPETASHAVRKMGLMEMFLRLPPHVQDDLKAQVERLYFKYYARSVMGSPQEQTRGTTGDLETTDTPNQGSRERLGDRRNRTDKPKALKPSPQKRR